MKSGCVWKPDYTGPAVLKSLICIMDFEASLAPQWQQSTEEAAMLEVQINVCALAPPEPMEHVLEALSELGRDDRLAVLIEREPHPLYRILDRHGYRHCITERPDHLYDLLIWRAT